MFYRSGWLRCVGLKYIGIPVWSWCLAFELVYRCDVRCYILYIILYYYYYILLYYYIISYTITILYIHIHYYIIIHILYSSVLLIYLPNLPSPNIPLLISSFPHPNPILSHSFYTCRYLHILIYIQSLILISFIQYLLILYSFSV